MATAAASVPSVREEYPQFCPVPVPPEKRAERAWIGVLRPFVVESEILSIYRDLNLDRVVNLQAGTIRSINDRRIFGSGDPNERYLVNMGTDFIVLILEYPGRRHSEAYALKPEICRQRFPFHPHLREDQVLLWKGRYIQGLCTDYAQI
jgi:hypothetical protein